MSGSFVRWRRDSDEISLVEGDHVERAIAQSQEQHLIPLKEDVAEWIAKTLDVSDVRVDNFMEALDTGVLLCKLVRLIQHKAEECRKKGLLQGPVPSMTFKCWENARSESFYARDNTENFLKWCRRFGVNESVLFESDGLVLHSQPRTVVLCLLELGRIASRYGVEPPGLIKLEREIEEEYGDRGSDEETGSNCSSATASSSPRMLCRSRTESAMSVGSSSGNTSRTRRPSGGGSSNRSSPRSSPSRCASQVDQTQRYTPTELDKKVMSIANTVCEDTTQIKRISEGRYKIAGKTVYIRLLKGRHVMVRVGGGWDTLEHYLSRHDPCQVVVVARRGSIQPQQALPHRELASRSSYPGSSYGISSNGRPSSATSNISSTSPSPQPPQRFDSKRASVPLSVRSAGHRRALTSDQVLTSETVSAYARSISPDSFLHIRSKYKSHQTNNFGVQNKGSAHQNGGTKNGSMKVGLSVQNQNGKGHNTNTVPQTRGKPVASSHSFSGYSSGYGASRSSTSLNQNRTTINSQVSKITLATVSSVTLNSAGNMRPTVAGRRNQFSYQRKTTS